MCPTRMFWSRWREPSEHWTLQRAMDIARPDGLRRRLNNYFAFTDFLPATVFFLPLRVRELLCVR